MKNNELFKCKICSNKEFKSKSALRSHMNFHKFKKPYPCQFKGCKKRFASSGDLARHNLVHTKEQPYACLVENCGRKFSRKCNLDRHNLVHTGEKPFRCQFCEFKTTQKQDLINHLKKKHNDKDLESIIYAIKPFKSSFYVVKNSVH